MSNRLRDKTAVITGGASGIGLATAKRFAAEGARVFITSRRQEGLDGALDQIGAGAEGVLVDASNLADLDNLYDVISQRVGSLDVVMANAAAAAIAPLGQITEEQVDAAFDTNVKGTIFTVQKALPLMGPGGSIILTGSSAGTTGAPGMTAYSASKAAVRNFARSWLLDLRARGIRVNVVSPGPIATPGLAGLVPPAHKDGLFDALAKGVPMGRLGKPEEIAKAVAYLASADASFVNGIELFVDGGKAQV